MINVYGKIFSLGDKILVLVFWSNVVEVKIMGFYKSLEGLIWVIFIF